MTTWQWILAWILYLSLGMAIVYNRATTVDAYVSSLDKTDWLVFYSYMAWWIGLGVLITSLIG